MKLTKIPLLVSVFLLLSLSFGQAWGANQVAAVDTAGTSIKYKAGTGANCSDTDGWTTGSDLEAAFTAAGASSTVYVCAGTYVGTMLDAADGFDTTANSQTLQAVGAVTINCAGLSDHCINAAGHTNISILGDSASNPLVMTGGANNYFIYAGSGAIKNIRINGGSGGGGLNIAGTNIISNVRISDISGTAYSMLVGGGAAVIAPILNNVIVQNANNQVPAIRISNTGTGSTLVGNQIAFFGNKAESLRLDTTSKAAVTINNPIIWGNSISTAAVVENISSAGGTITINNMIGQGNSLDPDDYNFTSVTMNDPIYNKSPMFISNRYPSAIAFVIDDTFNLDWYNDTVAPKLEAKGYRGTISLNYTHLTSASYFSAANIAKLKALEAKGHEISCHTRRHSDLTQTNTFTAYRGVETLSNDGTTVTSSGGYSYAVAGKTVTELRTDMVANGFTCGTMNTALNISTLPASYLANMTNQASSSGTPHNLQLDTTRYWGSEISGSKADLIGYGFNVTTFVPPGNKTSVGVRSYLQATAGFTGARGSGSDTLASTNIYNIGYRDINIGGTNGGHFSDYNACTGAGETEANCIKRNVIAFLGKMAAEGSVYVFYTHGESEWNATQWDAMLDAVEQSGVPVMTLAELVNYAKTYNPSGDLGTADNLTYTRTMVDVSDYRLKADSPAIDAGVATANHTSGSNIITGGDAAGNTKLYGRGIDVGAYERKKHLEDDLTGDWLPKYYKVP